PLAKAIADGRKCMNGKRLTPRRPKNIFRQRARLRTPDTTTAACAAVAEGMQTDFRQWSSFSICSA
ncbi:MAG: hypothetical protein KGN77_16695, partial [Xanthomonadaceae bacterium]|nr:hypothetical protein [Xanthomonadaceae bacterium]